MTREETVTIIRIIKDSYPTFKPDNITETVDVWHMMLEDQDGKVILMALKNYIRTNNSGFAPSIGQLMDYAQKITTPDELTGLEAWGLVMRAIRNSGYNYLKEFAKLPETVQKAVGTPEQLWNMAIDTNFNEAVEKSQFIKSYQIILTREKERGKMSADVLKLLDTVNTGTPKKLLEESNAERVRRAQAGHMIETKKHEPVPMPDEVREKLRGMLGM